MTTSSKSPPHPIHPFSIETTMRIALNCMILGESPDLAFVVEADRTKSIDHLKNLIKERRPDVFGDVVSVHITLWQVVIPLDVPNSKLNLVSKNRARQRRDPTRWRETPRVAKDR